MTDKDKIENKDEKKKEEKKDKIIYIGEDESYWQNFQKNIMQSYKQLAFNFLDNYEIKPQKIQSLIKYIFEERPKVVLIDMSKNSDDVLHLIRILCRTNALIKPLIIGLMDIKTQTRIRDLAILGGAPLLHMKVSEYDAIIFDIICFAFSNALERHKFAIARMNDEILASIPCKVGLVSALGIRVESNFEISEGQSYVLNNYWSNQKIIESRKVLAANQYESDLYYNYEYAQELGFTFVDPPEISPEMQEEQAEKIRNDHAVKVETAKAQMSTWVNKNSKENMGKNLKVLIIDKSLAFYDDQPRSDKYDIVLRVQPFLKYVKKELLKVYPQLIFYNLEEVETSELEANEDIAYSYNDSRTLQLLVKTVRSIEGFKPYIIVFNSQNHDTPKLQSILNYQNIMAYKEEISPPAALKMAKMLESKIQNTFQSYQVPTVVIEKEMLESYAEFQFSVKLIAFSEQDAYFYSDLPLQEKMVIRFSEPIPFYVTVAPPPNYSRVPDAYYGLIHAVNEKEKMELRKYVNSIFFRALEAEKLKEREEIEAAKEKFQKQKEEEERKAREREEALKAQEDSPEGEE